MIENNPFVKTDWTKFVCKCWFYARILWLVYFLASGRVNLFSLFCSLDNICAPRLFRIICLQFSPDVFDADSVELTCFTIVDFPDSPVPRSKTLTIRIDGSSLGWSWTDPVLMLSPFFILAKKLEDLFASACISTTTSLLVC